MTSHRFFCFYAPSNRHAVTMLKYELQTHGCRSSDCPEGHHLSPQGDSLGEHDFFPSIEYHNALLPFSHGSELEDRC
jgi:hypothetical protein